jgi:integrase
MFSDIELEHLASMNLRGHLAKVRDICLIGAGTGQRFSDFSRYTPNNFYRTINNIPILSVISTKTDTPAKIPLNIFPWLLPVLEKHQYATPKISMQKFNDGIKVLCEKAGFDENILKVEQYMGRKARVVKSYVPKYEEVSSHICRRSFATNMYKRGYRLSQIMPMTGHSTESQLRQYIGIDNEMNAEEIGLEILQSRKGKSHSNSTLKVVNS